MLTLSSLSSLFAARLSPGVSAAAKKAADSDAALRELRQELRSLVERANNEQFNPLSASCILVPEDKLRKVLNRLDSLASASGAVNDSARLARHPAAVQGEASAHSRRAAFRRQFVSNPNRIPGLRLRSGVARSIVVERPANPGSMLTPRELRVGAADPIAYKVACRLLVRGLEPSAVAQKLSLPVRDVQRLKVLLHQKQSPGAERKTILLTHVIQADTEPLIERSQVLL